MLHITNGESVVGTFRQVKFPGTYLSWLDVLHDGPVPQTQTLEELSDVRARALAGFGWDSYEKIRAGFAARDQVLAGFRRHEEIVLWFEHDLFDQLQLIQLLDWFAQQELGKIKLSLVQVNSYPGVTPFYGLGQLSGTQLARLFPARVPVTAAHAALAREAWQAFRSSEPGALLSCASRPSSALPFLAAALRRFFQEYPWTGDGLSRTERQVLLAAASGGWRRKEDLYGESRKQEETPWGDASVYLRMAGLAAGKNPALAKVGQDGKASQNAQDEKMSPDKNAGQKENEKAAREEYEITDSGRQLLAGKADWITLRGGIDRWLGGVHLAGPQPQWRWDERAETVVSS
jgi:hypothetical protein